MNLVNKQIVLASDNLGKINEFSILFRPWNIEVIPQSKFDVPEIEETGLSFVENALLKARHCAQYTKLPILADDSGLCVDWLFDKPGIYSARYSGKHASNTDNIKKVLAQLDRIPFHDRKAYLQCVLVFLQDAKDQNPIIASGRLHGHIAEQQSGDNGFGYDAIFDLIQYGHTLAQLDDTVKNMISHRARAVLSFQQQILRQYRTI